MECLLVSQCAPTLAGLKPASLFCWHVEHKQLLAELKHWNQRLQTTGIRIRRLQTQSTFSLIYVYRPTLLQQYLLDEEVRTFLEGFGYTGESLEADLQQLQRRLSESDGFPHEIGLFLGYPLKDVSGFIQNQGKNFQYTGYWKVYGDSSLEKRQFFAYRMCTKLLCRCYAHGVGVVELAAIES